MHEHEYASRGQFLVLLLSSHDVRATGVLEMHPVARHRRVVGYSVGLVFVPPGLDIDTCNGFIT